MSATQRRECCTSPVGKAPTGTTTKMKPASGPSKIPGSSSAAKPVSFKPLTKR